MFCNGECIKDNQRCGLLLEIIMEAPGKEPFTENKCALQAIFEANCRAERQRDGLHAAENSTRNELSKQLDNINIAQKNGLSKIKNVLSIGMIGILKKKKLFNKKNEDQITQRIKLIDNGE